MRQTCGDLLLALFGNVVPREDLVDPIHRRGLVLLAWIIARSASLCSVVPVTFYFSTFERHMKLGILRRAASLRRLTFAPARKFRRAASRAELFRTCCHQAFRSGALCRRLVILGQRFLELLFDA